MTGRSGKRVVGSSDLDAALGAVERVLLDTSALIAFHSPQEQVHSLADYVLRRIESDADSLRGYYSAVSASEILIRPLRTSLADFTGMQSFLTNYPHLTVLPADLAVAAQAANVRAFSRISTPDAFVIATGLVSGCEAIVSNDERWKRQMAPIFPQFRWIYLKDYL